MRLIDADAFIQEQCNSCDGYCEKVDCDCLSCNKPYQCDVIQELKNAPTISPDEARGVGEWIKLDAHKGMEQYKCSTCNTPIYVPECMGEPMYSFCPMCGAKMEATDDA